MPENHSIVRQHPTGIAGTVTAAAIMLIEKFSNVDFSSTEVALLVGAVVGVASALSPRFRRN